MAGKHSKIPWIKDVSSKAEGHARALRSHIPGALMGRNPEHVHQLRVAARRLRECLRILFRAGPGARSIRGLQRDVRRFARLFARSRELDVALLILKNGPGPLSKGLRRRALSALGGCLKRRIRTNRKILLRTLAGGQTARLYRRIRLITLPDISPGGPPILRPRRDSNLAIRMIEERLREARARLGRVRGERDVRRLHRFRISVKKLRYTTEMALPVLPAAWRPRLAGWRELQSVLGRLHDDDVTAKIYRSAMPDIPSSRRPAVIAACEALQRDEDRQSRRLRLRLGNLI